MPRQAVAFAVLLLAAGFSCLVAGLALGAQGTDNATALFVLGALMFTPVSARRPHGSRRRSATPRAEDATRAPAARLQQKISPSVVPRRGLTRCALPQGAYYSFLSFKAWRKADGFSFDALPEL